MILFLIGCHHANTAVTPAAGALNRLPAPVASAFAERRPGVTPTHVHVRLFPDGTTRYQIQYVDENGRPQQAVYFADGRTAP